MTKPRGLARLHLPVCLCASRLCFAELAVQGALSMAVACGSVKYISVSGCAEQTAQQPVDSASDNCGSSQPHTLDTPFTPCASGQSCGRGRPSCCSLELELALQQYPLQPPPRQLAGGRSAEALSP